MGSTDDVAGSDGGERLAEEDGGSDFGAIDSFDL